MEVTFYEWGAIDDHKLQFAVIMTRCSNRWVFVRNKDRTTWEIPGGHRDNHEPIENTASRELFEETGIRDSSITPVCFYTISDGVNKSYGALFFCDAKELGTLPESEIAEVRLFQGMPEDLTYPLVQPSLYKKIQEFVTKKGY